jgi:cytochrome c biogenesis protein CcdA
MKISIVFSFAMSFVYLGIGIFLIISKEIFNSEYISQTILGLIIVLYGLARLYLALKKYRESKIKDENNDEV